MFRFSALEKDLLLCAPRLHAIWCPGLCKIVLCALCFVLPWLAYVLCSTWPIDSIWPWLYFVYYLRKSLIVFFRFASQVATTICTLSRRSSVRVDGAWSRGDLHSRRLCVWMGPGLEAIRHKWTKRHWTSRQWVLQASSQGAQAGSSGWGPIGKGGRGLSKFIYALTFIMSDIWALFLAICSL